MRDLMQRAVDTWKESVVQSGEFVVPHQRCDAGLFHPESQQINVGDQPHVVRQRWKAKGKFEIEHGEGRLESILFRLASLGE